MKGKAQSIDESCLWAAWFSGYVTLKYLLSESLNVFAAHLLFLSACLSLLISLPVCLPLSLFRLCSVHSLNISLSLLQMIYLLVCASFYHCDLNV